MWYNKYVVPQTARKRNKKVLDKLIKMWYNETPLIE